MRAPRSLLSAAAALLALPAAVSAQTFGPDFVNDYTLLDLGQVPGVPSPLGGCTFLAGDTATLLIGGAANSAAGTIYSVGVNRDAAGHVVGFAGQATFFASASMIDGGLTYGPGGVLFFVTYPDNRMGQLKPGSSAPDKWIDLSPLGVSSSTGALQFVPSGFAGAGALKIVSYNASTWYEADLVADGQGTYDLANVTLKATITGGPEGMVYIGAANPGFTKDSVLVSEWSAGQVGAYEIDAQGDPLPATRRDFLSSLSGAEGAVIDPLTGDFLFSTFGGGDRVIVVRGFTGPLQFCDGKVNSAGCTPAVTWTGSPTLTGADDFDVRAHDVLNQSWGVLMWSRTAGSTPFGGGTLCLTSPTNFLPALLSGGTAGTPRDCSGSFTRRLDQSWMATNALVLGDVVYLQFVSRDVHFAPPANLSLSDGLAVTILQ